MLRIHASRSLPKAPSFGMFGFFAFLAWLFSVAVGFGLLGFFVWVIVKVMQHFNII